MHELEVVALTEYWLRRGRGSSADLTPFTRISSASRQSHCSMRHESRRDEVMKIDGGLPSAVDAAKPDGPGVDQGHR
ncbi:hypothetical protein MRB53_040963 [Persea americana]|nr:hypothetical protein MRB53_040963 [Persea americana]